MRAMNLTLRYAGEFMTNPSTATDTQCGVKGQPRYKYEVEIICPNEVVDGTTGFLVDNAEVPKYFDNLYTSIDCPSCERIAEKAVDHFVSMLEDDSANPECVRVRVIPNEFASLEAEWLKGMGRLSDDHIPVIEVTLKNGRYNQREITPVKEIERKTPTKGYIIGDGRYAANTYRSTAVAYMKRNQYRAVKNIDGNIYEIEELEASIIKRPRR